MIFQVKDCVALQTALDGLCKELSVRQVEQDCIFDCKLVACELLSNALKYGGGKADLQAELQGGYIVLKVLSQTEFELPEQIECSGLFAENGRGLFLVNTLCEGEIHTDRKSVV